MDKHPETPAVSSESSAPPRPRGGAPRDAQRFGDPPRRVRPLLVVLSAAIAVGGLGFLLASSSDIEFYKHVDEVMRDPAQWQHKRLQLHGFVVPGTIAKRIDRDHQKLEYKFRVENCGAVTEAHFAGVVPDTFKEGAEVVLKGQFNGPQFQTSEVMAKCPSKYAQGGEQQSAMLTRCSRDSTSGAKGN